MSSTEDTAFAVDPEELGPDIPIAPQEHFVNGVYSSVDEATARGLDRLRSDDGVVPTCERGCCHCCRYNILTNIAEAHALVQYVKREFTADQIDALRMRTQQWHEWDDSRPGRYPSAPGDGQTEPPGFEHPCPLLVDGVCSVYPVRPIVCRTHFVSSHPLSCSAANDPESTEDAPVVLTSVVAAASSFPVAMKDHIESTGLDFSRSIMLLPHWLANKMGWDFAVSF